MTACLLLLALMPLKQPTMSNSTINQATALHYLVRTPKTTSVKHKAIILLHGVGSNEEDLFSLAGHLPDDHYIISARGRYTLGQGRYAWYNVDFSSGKPVFNAEQELSSRAAIKQFITQVKEKYQLEEIYLGGFSQGAIMSYSIGLTAPAEVRGIFVLSGRLLDEVRSLIKPTGSLRVFIAHGKADGTLPVQYARDAKAYLEKMQVNLSYHEYEMGHQVNAAVIKDLNSWITQ